MKKSFAMILAMILILSISACSAETDKAENPYRLQSYTGETYRNGEVTYTFRVEYFYDGHGWLSQAVHSDNQEKVTTTHYTYDEYGNLLSMTDIRTDGTQAVMESTLTLDEEHRVIRSEEYWDGDFIAVWEYAYDKNGNQTMLNINRIGALEGEDWISYTNMTYDRDGNMIREDVRWEPTGDSNYILYTYKDNKLVKSTTYTLTDALKSHTDYTYDETGLIQTAVTYDASGTATWKNITTSDEYGNVLEEKSFRYNDHLPGGDDEEMDGRYIYTYELIEPTE